jgi:hypothetical protein
MEDEKMTPTIVPYHIEVDTSKEDEDDINEGNNIVERENKEEHHKLHI